ncbi:alpha/beta fold hydrolase [Nesterenkonia natronophila]|uniref:Alpha/beta hydrolase n=1 Tax=Nesterenkonia natronophila TaxID=2174932 RepID=A0A3A4F632_9MICC|nr:alpha/beta hydrolase [Nesterenkonia natronophila]RJN33171.1 alpha/beta hydrolase [Nesterenkonia natronophila]
MFQTAGAKLAYEVVGDEADPLFVQTHGLTSSAWREHRAGLDVTGGLGGFRVLRYDSRGHGSSTGRAVPEDYLWSQLAEDLLALLDAVAPGEQVHTGGPSMGAATQICAALLDPTRFASLSLLVPPTAWSTRRAQTDQYLRSAELVENEGIGAFVRMGEAILPPPALADRPRERVPVVSQELLPSILRGASMTDLPPPEKFAQLEVPLQILAWTNDRAHPVSTAEELHRLHRNSQLSIAETPEDLATWPTQVARFVERHRR